MLPYLAEECKKHIVSSGSNFQGGKDRIQKILNNTSMSRNDKIKALKDEYGIGGMSVDLAIYDSGMQMHDAKGISYFFWDSETDDPSDARIAFTWPQVLALYEERGVVYKNEANSKKRV